MKVVLPVEIKNVSIISECWTFWRLAIIQTSIYAEDWLASHFRLFAKHDLLPDFSDSQRIYTTNYYDGILETHYHNLQEINNENIIEMIKSNLNNQRYVVLYTNCSSYGQEPWLHEILINGYNDEKEIFYIVEIKNRIYHLSEYTFSDIKLGLILVKKWLNYQYEEELNLLRNFQSIFTTYKLSQKYDTTTCVYYALNKIEEEFNGRIATFVNEKQEKEQCYYGIACLFALEKLLYGLLNDLNDSLVKEFYLRKWNLDLYIRKIYEHRSLLLLSMKYIQKDNYFKNMKLESFIKKYEECCLKVKKWYMMASKYDITQDKSILIRISSEINCQYEQEKQILEIFINCCLDKGKNE